MKVFRGIHELPPTACLAMMTRDGHRVCWTPYQLVANQQLLHNDRDIYIWTRNGLDCKLGLLSSGQKTTLYPNLYISFVRKKCGYLSLR